MIDPIIVSFVGTCFLLLLSVIGFFTKQALNRLSSLEKDRMKDALIVSQLQKDTEQGRISRQRMRDDMRRHEDKIETFVDKFPELIKTAVEPLFMNLKTEIGYLKESINELKK